MASRKAFVVKMYESEYRQIQAWVARYQNLETGGDLFGLWADEHTAVVQLVLGPGKNCRRTVASFYQDVDYLERVGNILTNEEGLCHIGEWHSHHRLGLSRPSGGDENTVWTNMDRYYVQRFFLFIATIGSSSSDVNIGCFLFEINPNTKKRLPVLKGEIHPFSWDEESPFRISAKEHLAIGAESQNSPTQLNEFKAIRSNYHERDPAAKRTWYDNHEHDPKKAKLQDKDKDKDKFPTTTSAIDQTIEDPNNYYYYINEVNNQESDKSENMEEEVTEKSNLSQGVNRYRPTTQDNNDKRSDQQSNLTENNNKPETLKNQPSTPATTEEKSSSDKGTKRSSYKVTYMGRETKAQQNKAAQEKQNDVLEAEETSDKQGTQENIPKNNIHPNVTLVNVKPVEGEESNTNQQLPPNALDRTKNTIIEDASNKRAEDEFKDAQQNDIKKSNAICSEEEETEETRSLLEDEESETDEKLCSCSCFGGKRRTKEKKGAGKREEEETEEMRSLLEDEELDTDEKSPNRWACFGGKRRTKVKKGEKEKKKKEKEEKKKKKKKENKEKKEKKKTENEEKKKKNKKKKEKKKKDKEEKKDKKKKENEEKKEKKKKLRKRREKRKEKERQGRKERKEEREERNIEGIIAN